jgi:hypothetical protein
MNQKKQKDEQEEKELRTGVRKWTWNKMD